MIDDDPFSMPATSRFKGRGTQLGGVLGSLRGTAQNLASAAQPVVGQAVGQAAGKAIDWAASNPDKLEAIGERVGQAAAMGTGGGFFARKAGKKVGGKLGRMASEKAQGMQGDQTGQGGSSSFAFDPNDPFQ